MRARPPVRALTHNIRHTQRYEPTFPFGVLWKIGVLGKPSYVLASMPSDGSWPDEAHWEGDKHLKIESSEGPGN